MKILLVAKLNSGNTYIDSLYESLKEKNLNVSISEEHFWDHESAYDIIHVHWIESLFNWNIRQLTEEDYSRLKFRLENLKKSNTKLILTKHNEFPHHLHENRLIRKVYNLFYEYTDGIIHLGQYSLNKFRENYVGTLENIEHVIINHGNYLNLKNNTSKQTARNILNISENRFVFLCFGKFRVKEERSIVIKAFKKTNIESKTLLSTTWNFGYGKENMFSKIKRFILNLSSNYKLFNAYISEDNIQTYMNAADVLIVPRINSLNSGLVYLGLSFGKIIIGPTTGNITEIMEETNNLKFVPNDVGSLSSAMKKAFALKDTDIDYKNMVFARDYCSWDDIAQAHVNSYTKIAGH